MVENGMTRLLGKELVQAAPLPLKSKTVMVSFGACVFIFMRTIIMWSCTCQILQLLTWTVRKADWRVRDV